MPIPSRLAVRSGRPVLGITVHVTVTGAGDPLGTWRNIQGAAMGGSLPSGDLYGDIPYHDGISMDGRIVAGRNHRYVGAHAKSARNLANELTDGVAFIGTGQGVSDAAKAAFRAYLYLWTVEHHRRPILFDHRDWWALGGIQTACPDDPIAAFVAQLRAEARTGR